MSKKSYFVLSTLATDMLYVNHRKGAADLPETIGEGVFIAGGANVIDKRLITPAGIVTKINGDQLEYLQANDLYLMHEKNGFLTLSEHQPEDIEKAVAEAAPAERDPSAPLVEADFAPEEKPIVNGDPAPAASAPAGNSRRA